MRHEDHKQSSLLK